MHIFNVLSALSVHLAYFIRSLQSRIQTLCYFQPYQQAILLPQCGTSLLQLIESPQEFRVLTHQEPIVSTILKNKHSKDRCRVYRLLAFCFYRKPQRTRAVS